MIKVDIHNHLGRNGENLGFDGTIDLVDKRLGSNSIFGIANSDDYRYEEFVEQEGGKYSRQEVAGGRAIYVPEKSILVVKCQEMFTQQGDILAIAMPKESKNIRTQNTEDAIKAAKDLGAVLDAVHPFYIDGIGNFLLKNPELLENFSTCEVYNGSAALVVPPILPRKSNRKTLHFYEQLAREKGLGMSASTDGHSVRVIGKSYTELPTGPQNLDELVPLSADDFLNTLDEQFKDVVSLEYLHMQANRMDAFNHAVDVTMDQIKVKFFF